MTGAPLLSVRDLAVSFGRGARRGARRCAASRSTSARRETVALVGESGSGKSVTALALMRLLPYPQAWHPGGAIRFAGEDVLTARRERGCARCAATASR